MDGRRKIIEGGGEGGGEREERDISEGKRREEECKQHGVAVTNYVFSFYVVLFYRMEGRKFEESGPVNVHDNFINHRWYKYFENGFTKPNVEVKHAFAK